MEAGIENVRDANLLEDPKRCVHETTLESMEKYCEDVHGGEEEKMLKAMVLSCNGNMRGGATMAKLIIFVRETGIENVRVTKSLALNVKPVVKKLNDGRIIVVFVVNRKDPLVKSLLDKYANYT